MSDNVAMYDSPYVSAEREIKLRKHDHVYYTSGPALKVVILAKTLNCESDKLKIHFKFLPFNLPANLVQLSGKHVRINTKAICPAGINGFVACLIKITKRIFSPRFLNVKFLQFENKGPDTHGCIHGGFALLPKDFQYLDFAYYIACDQDNIWFNQALPVSTTEYYLFILQYIRSHGIKLVLDVGVSTCAGLLPIMQMGSRLRNQPLNNYNLGIEYSDDAVCFEAIFFPSGENRWPKADQIDPWLKILSPKKVFICNI